MKITIQGLDYTSAFDGAQPLTIERKLNEPSQCRLGLALQPNSGLPVPARGALIEIAGDDGTVYFTGAIVVSPSPKYAGLAQEGPLYKWEVVALSDEVLLDEMPMPPCAGIAGETVGSLIDALVTHSGSLALTMKSGSADALVGNVSLASGAKWSKGVQEAATIARVAYRVLNGMITIVPIQSIVHVLDEADNRFNPANLTLAASADRLPANDVTICGEHEPVAYVTEYFRGDGVTTSFYLSADPYFPPAAKAGIIRELFDERELDKRIWASTGEAGYFSLGSGGLEMNGGTGVDGQTVLSWIDPVEMGGTLLLEAAGVTLAAGSAGILAGFFDGGTDSTSCTVGFQVTAQQGTGNLNLQPLVQGALAGTVFTLTPSNQYTLRVRVHGQECNRALAIYRSASTEGAITAGGGWNLSPGKLQLEVQEFVNGVGGMPVTLYDGSVASLPGTCSVAVASSLDLTGSVRACHLVNLGSGWVVSTPTSGGAYTRRMGSSVEAGECQLGRNGKLQFEAGSVPALGEIIAVSYRTIGRAVGRSVNAESQQALALAGLPSEASWIGSAMLPQARSSADCRNAALVTVQTSADNSGLVRGRYKGTNCEFSSDVWPGDALLLNAPSANLDVQVIVRSVSMSYRSSLPDVVEYGINFANEWTEDLAIKRSTTVPEDAWLPAPVAPTYLPNLNGLAVTTLNGSTVEINTGIAPPAGGGFEVRRGDFAFMAGTDPGLVIRSSQPNIVFSRQSANDRFYVRMYDGATPPNYSEYSTALFINLPLGS